MKNSQKGFLPLLILIVIAIATIGSGIYVYSKNIKNNSGQQNATSTTQQMKDNRVTDNWKTYTNAKYGFSLRYPLGSNQTPKETSDESGTKLSVELPIVETGTNLDGKTLIVTAGPQVAMTCLQEAGYARSKTDSTINGIHFFVEEGGEGAAGHGYSYTTYSTANNGNCIHVQLVLSSLNDVHAKEYNGGPLLTIYDKNKELEVLNQIMATFKLTSNNSISGWKIYTNSKLGFSVEYPPTGGVTNTENFDAGSKFVVGVQSNDSPIQRSVDIFVVDGGYVGANGHMGCGSEGGNDPIVTIHGLKFTKTKYDLLDEGYDAKTYSDIYCVIVNGFEYDINPKMIIQKSVQPLPPRSQYENDQDLMHVLQSFILLKSQ